VFKMGARGKGIARAAGGRGTSSLARMVYAVARVDHRRRSAHAHSGTRCAAAGWVGRGALGWRGAGSGHLAYASANESAEAVGSGMPWSRRPGVASGVLEYFADTAKGLRIRLST